MNASLAEQLKNISIDWSTKDYGKIPLPEQLFALQQKLPKEEADALAAQWETLKLLRKNLLSLDKYIKENRGETLAQWVRATGNGIADRVYKEMGNANDSTKGITGYFLNLQNVYDNEEEKYDKMESSKSTVKGAPVSLTPEFDNAHFEVMRIERGSMRKNRTKSRNLRLKDLRKDKLGYIILDEEPAQTEDIEVVEEKSVPPEIKKSEAPQPKKIDKTEAPAKQNITEKPQFHTAEVMAEPFNADAENITTTPTKVVTTQTPNPDVRNAVRKKILITLAGVTLVVLAFAAFSGDKKTT